MGSKALFRTAAAAALFAAVAVCAQTNVYRWVDKDGNVHFSDQPPAQDARNVTQKRMGGGYIEESQLPYATQVAMKRFPVVMYTSDNCGELCANGRALLSSRGIPYTERNAQKNQADAEALKQIAGGLQVPVLMVGDKSTRGFDEGLWNAALDEAGYPRTRLPGQVSPKAPEPQAGGAPASQGASAPAPAPEPSSPPGK